MITLNGKKFARNDAEFTDSLFHKDGTCVGFYRKHAKSIELMDQHKARVGVINKHKVLACATKRPDGRYWYNHADIDLIGRWPGYMAGRENIEHVYRQVFASAQ